MCAVFGRTHGAEGDAQHFEEVRLFVGDEPKDRIGNDTDQEKDQR